MKKGNNIGIILIVIVLMVTGFAYCSFSEGSKIDEGDVLYRNEEPFTLSFITNKMVDTYIIAASLYMDFNSNIIMPNANSHPVYKQAKEYFSQHKDHSFIKDFNGYVINGDINGDAIGVLLSYDGTPELNKVKEIDSKYRQYIFKDEKNIEHFISGLRDFYKDTDAEEYFYNNNDLNDITREYINRTVNDSKLEELLVALDKYIFPRGNDRVIKYENIISLYRPNFASFFYYDTMEDGHYITLQSTTDYSRDPYKLDINTMVENAIHEYIHCYINGEVEKYFSNREPKVTDKTALTNNNMYNNMPLNRQADEYLVRAIEARLYKKIYSEEYAFERIMNKNIWFNGFNDLEKFYRCFEVYENDMDKYENIFEFLPNIMEEMLVENKK